MADTIPVFIVRYGEIGLKSRTVRNRFEARLVSNIEDMFLLTGIPCTWRRDGGHVYIYTDRTEDAIPVLRRVFGIVSYDPAEEFKGDKGAVIDHIARRSMELLEDGDSFAVRSRRTGTHDFTSQELARDAGAAVLDANKGRGISVNLTNPEKELHIEVRGERNYLFTRIFDGPGGMPVGTQGKVLAIVGGRDGIVAAWMMAKRGCSVTTFLLDPALSNIHEVFKAWSPKSKYGKCRSSGEEDGNALEEAVEYAGKTKCKALVTARRQDPVKMDIPVFYPLSGLKDEDVHALAERIGL